MEPIKLSKYQTLGGIIASGAAVSLCNPGLGWMGFPGRLGMRPEINNQELDNDSSIELISMWWN